MFDLFILHADVPAEASFVRDELVPALGLPPERVRLSSELPLGATIVGALEEGIATSPITVVVVSPAFLRDTWAGFGESLASHAAAKGRVLVPLLFADCEVPLRLDMRVGLDCRDPARRPAEIARLRQRLSTDPIAPTRSRIYNPPPLRAKQLFGREADLRALEEKLTPGSTVGLAASIEGLAGVGKTELAAHLVYQLAAKGRFPGGIFWFDAENADLTPTWGGVIADALAIPPGPIETRAAAARHFAERGEPVLLVVDSAQGWSKVERPHPLVIGPQVAILVTTRHRFLGGQAFDHHTLECLTDEAARAFLYTLAGRDLDDAPGADDLLRHLGGHALAVELAGAYLREYEAVTPATYLERLVSGQAVQERVIDVVGYQATVAQAIDASWNHLDGAARRALQITGCFADAYASVALLTLSGVDDASLHQLRRFHLVSVEGERWNMHRLVRAYARKPGSQRKDARVRRAFVQGCVDLADGFDVARSYLVYRIDGVHLERAIEIASSESIQPDVAGHLLERLGVSARAAGDYRRARSLLERSLASGLQNRRADEDEIANRRNSLAMLLTSLGDLSQARELLEQSMASVGDDDFVFRTNLAMVYKGLGDLPQACTLLEEVLASRLRELDEDHFRVALIRGNLAGVLYDLGDFAQARVLLEQALASDVRKHREDHPSADTRRARLALVLQKLGDLRQARALFEQTLATAIREMGEQHPAVATKYFNLAGVCDDEGDLPAARALLEKALAIEEQMLGSASPSTAYTRARLAWVTFRLGDQSAARVQAQRALDDIRGQDHGSVHLNEIEMLAELILPREP